MAQEKNNKAEVPLGNEVHFKGVWQLPCGSYTAEILDPIKKKNIWLGIFTTAKKAAKAYDKAARLFGSHRIKTNIRPDQLQTRDFLRKLDNNNAMSTDHILPNQSSDIASSSRSSGDAASFQNSDEFCHFMTVTGTPIVMSKVRDKDLLESLMKAGVILPEPKMSSQKETLDFMGLGAVQPPTNSVEPPDLELRLAPPGSM